MKHSRRLVAIIAAAAAAGALEFALPGAVTPKVADAAPTLRIAGDFNGDGYADLAVGDHGSTVYVYYGGPNGIDTNNPLVFTPQTAGMPSQLASCADVQPTNCSFGFSLLARDFSGDGYSDLAIGAPDYGYPNRPNGEDGAVVILKGGPAGLSTQGSAFIGAPSSLTVLYPNNGTGFGWSLASGDFNHDGHADLAIGSPFASLGSTPTVGAVTIMYGSASGLTSGQTVVNQATPGIAGPAATVRDAFGWEIAVGDFNHDGFSDLAIAVPHEDGDVVLYGSAAGLTTAGSQYLQGAGGEAYQVAAGDFNGNGYDDLAVGQSCINVVEIHYGGAHGLGSVAFKTAQEITPNSPGMPKEPGTRGYFGYSLAVGDIKHTGRADLVVAGAPVGPIALWGTSTKLSTKGSAVVGTGVGAGPFVALTDLNGDGYADLLSYVPFSTGAVYDGSSTGVSKTAAAVLAHTPANDSVRGVPDTSDLLCGGP